MAPLSHRLKEAQGFHCNLSFHFTLEIDGRQRQVQDKDGLRRQQQGLILDAGRTGGRGGQGGAVLSKVSPHLLLYYQ